jgi:hypothetical protein
MPEVALVELPPYGIMKRASATRGMKKWIGYTGKMDRLDGGLILLP